MRLGSKTALGIDISERRISLALLEKSTKGISLLRSASGPVPEGAIEDGSIKDPAILSKALRELKTRNRIRADASAVSLFARPAVVRIMEMSGPVPANLGQYVQRQLRQCVVLSGKRTVSDFCGIGSAGQADGRILVAAAEDQQVAAIVKGINKARLHIEAIEPPLLAYARAVGAKRIAGKFDCNILLAILRDGELTICVFKKVSLDFVRTKPIDKEDAQPGGICHHLAEEINAVIRFYAVDIADDSGKWEVTVVADDAGQLPDDAEEALKASVEGDNVQFRTAETAVGDTPFGDTASRGGAQGSVAAIGLAMKLLAENDESLGMNLLPPEAADVKSLKKHALIAGNIAAVLVLLMILTVYGLEHVIAKANAKVAQKRSANLLNDTGAMIREVGSIDEQIVRLSDECVRLNEILDSRHGVDWQGLLDDIKRGTPRTLRVTSLRSRKGSEMSLQGVATSYEAVHLFVRMLDKSRHVESASLVETGKGDTARGLVRYVISCFLVPKERT
ncbi:MAG: pilus assembly protein PilM [Phycisphaerales bacterium]|nr:MAG: pilus assembly protein PilM [Phycisphaerales bacterium]